MRKKCFMWLLAALLFAAPSCKLIAPPAETTAATTTKPAVTSTNPPIDVSADKPVFSNTIFDKDGRVFYVDPYTGFLTCRDARTGAAVWATQVRAHREFLLVEDNIFFRRKDDGRICVIGEDGGELTELLAMPFSRGAMIGEWLYFVDETVDGAETALYKYSPSARVWSMSPLSGNKCSPVRNTLVFTGDAAVYIDENNGSDSLVALDLNAMKKETIYESHGGRIYELLYDDGVLYFNDTSKSGFTALPCDGSGSPAEIPLEGDRIFGVQNGDILYGEARAGHDAVFYGNADGQSAERMGGVIRGGYSSHTFVSKTDADGSEGLYLVDYLSDDELQRFPGRLRELMLGERYALAVFEDDPEYSLIDLRDLTEIKLAGGTETVTGIPVADYIAGQYLAGVIPDVGELKGVSASVAAQVIGRAVCKNDIRTLELFLGIDGSLPPYYAFCAKSCRPSRASAGENGVIFSMEYAYYTEKDGEYAQYLPEALRGPLRLVRTDDGWRIEK